MLQRHANGAYAKAEISSSDEQERIADIYLGNSQHAEHVARFMDERYPTNRDIATKLALTT